MGWTLKDERERHPLTVHDVLQWEPGCWQRLPPAVLGGTREVLQVLLVEGTKSRAMICGKRNQNRLPAGAMEELGT